MTIKQIQDLIKFVTESGAYEVEIENEGFRIKIRTTNGNTIIDQKTPIPLKTQVNDINESETQTISKSVTNEGVIEAQPANWKEIRSPMIGTFYRRSAPDKEPFVNVGDFIEKGKVICIIEAMKLFNEIEAEFSGKVVKIMVEDSSPVEYDQPLFLLEINS